MKNSKRFWHIVKDSRGEVIEQYLTGTDKKQYSLIMSAELVNGSYEVSESSF